MQRRRGAVVAHIGDDFVLRRQRIQPREIRALMDETALVERPQKI